ncbi:MAG: portal protein, partial [Hyphomicrobiales bacterium]
MNNPLRWLLPTRTSAPKSAAPAETKSFTGTSFLALSGASRAGWTQADYTSLCQKGFMANPIVNRCVRLTAESASAIPLLIYENSRELDSHPMLDLLKRPNAQQPGQTFMETLLGYLLVSGNAYVELVEEQSDVREMHALRPDRVKPTIGRNGWISGYEYSVGSTKQRHTIDEAGLCAVLHL